MSGSGRWSDYNTYYYTIRSSAIAIHTNIFITLGIIRDNINYIIISLLVLVLEQLVYTNLMQAADGWTEGQNS